MLTLTLLFSFAKVAYWFLWLLLLLSMLLLIGVILLQEGKGGGLAEAFGGAGAETFGVKAHGINKFTAIVGAVFLVLCILLNKIHVESESEALVPGFEVEKPEPPDLPGGMGQPEQGGGAPAGGGSTPPGGQPPAGGPPPPGSQKPEGN
jgi:preprotein translocase subunit SecG